MGTAAGVGAAANIVGGEIQGWAAIMAQKEMKRAYERELRRQGKFRKEGTKDTLFPHIDTLGAENANRMMAEAAMGRMQGYDAINQNVGSAEDQAYLRLAGATRAANRGYGDWQNDQAINNVRLQDKINRIISKAGGRAAVFPLVMQDAQHSWDQLAAVGQAISSIGGSAANYAQLMNSQPQQGGQARPIYPSYTATGPDGQTYVWQDIVTN